MKTAVIFGAQGQLGSDITAQFNHANYTTYTPTHNELDITQPKDIELYLNTHKPDVVINTAAYHHVDLCEANPQLATLINTTAPAFIARVCNQLQSKFVHFSTDYVFDGSKTSPYLEQDQPNPLNQYGKSKWLCEQEVMNENSTALILRVSALYGHQPCRAKNGLNFVQLMQKLAKEKPVLQVVGDEFVSPTSTSSIAAMLPQILQHDIHGIAHLTSEGWCSWHEFATRILELTHCTTPVEKVNSSFFPAKTPRPKYSVLENNVLKKYSMVNMPHWEESLTKYLHQLN